MHATRSLFVAGFVTLIAISITFGYWVSRERIAEDYLSRAVELQSRHAGTLLLQQFKSFEIIARSIKGLLESSDEVTSEDFRRFTESLSLRDVAPNLQGVGFAAYFTGYGSLERAELALTNYYKDRRYHVKPGGLRSAYAPLVFMEPQTRNESVIGFDVLSSAEARPALQRARESGELIASDRLILMQDEGVFSIDSFVFYLAVYRSRQTNMVPGVHAASLTGWVDLPFRLSDVFRPIAASMDRGIQLQILDNDEPQPLIQAFENGQALAASSARSSSLGVSDMLNFGGRSWLFRVEPTEAFLSEHRDMAHHWITAIALLLSLSLGYIVYLLLTSRDRANELAMQMTAALRERTSDLNDTLDAIPDLLFEMDRQAQYVALRTSSKASLNMPVEKMLGRSAWEVLSPDAASVVQQSIDEAHAKGRSTGATLVVDIDGISRHFELSVARKAVAPGFPERFIVLSRDITDRILAERQAFQLAYFDTLSGLPTRSRFLADASARLEACLDVSRITAIVLIDLDNFNAINDQGGHSYGDALLQEIARRLRAAVSETDMLARFSGDEFVILLTNLGATVEEALRACEALCTRLLESISQPILIDGRESFVTASIGIAVAVSGELSLDALISSADFAMYEVKRNGGDAYCFFDRELQRRAAEHIELEQDMRSGLSAGEFRLLYQPQLDEQGSVLGAEALCRWQHPSKGAIPPDQFIELAERSGFITTLGRWVMQQACETLAAWRQDATTAGKRMAVNVSARQFHHPDFVQEVQDIVTQAGIDPALLELELTESILAHDVDGVVQKMAALQHLGVRFSLDDFGTGYSSLSYLKRLPIHQLKIDQSFVRDVLSDKCSASILCTIITLGKSLDLEVIAEGVETTEQRRFLLENGCRQFQGYLFSQPLSDEDLRIYIKTTGELTRQCR